MSDLSEPSRPGLPPPPPPSASISATASATSIQHPTPPVKPHNHPPPPSEAVAAVDPRVHLDQTSNKWAYEDEQGDEWEWDQSFNAGRGSWRPVINQDCIRAQQQAYARDGVDDEEPVDAVQRRLTKKRKASPSSISASNTKNAKPKLPKPITSIFVTGLPLDATTQEIAQVFSRYGVLNEDEFGNPRIKLYHHKDDKSGSEEMFKGEALITYFKPESVELAINILDGSCLRASLGQSKPEMKVTKAEWGKKDEGHDKDKGKGAAENTTSGTGDGSGEIQDEKEKGGKKEIKGKKVLTEQEKKKVQKRMARIQGKLEDWDSDSDPESSTRASMHPNALDPKAKVVILSRMFTLAELDQEPELLLDLKEDVREECETFGKVSVVKLWDKEPEGIMTVRFAEASAARACVQKMQGRFFASRTIQAVLSSSKPKFRTSDHQDEEDADEDEEGRKEAFGDWLENGGGD